MKRYMWFVFAVLIATAELLSEPRAFPTSTWTIVAADPVTGDVGVAGASCIPKTYGDALAALVPGRGAAATQALWDLDNRNRVYDLLQNGISAEEILRNVANSAADPAFEDRQYGVVTIQNGRTTAAAFTGKETMPWSGSQQDESGSVTVQGNILAGAQVVGDAMKAFKADNPEGNLLSDRLMRALQAGSAAGGDTRCNGPRGRQTAALAFILVARGGDPPYATADLGITDEGHSNAPWLDLSVAEPSPGPNPVTELRRRYNRWRNQRGRVDVPGLVSKVTGYLWSLRPIWR